jgi:hypothetical protein
MSSILRLCPSLENLFSTIFGVQQVSGLLDIYGKDIERGGQRYPALLSDSTLAQYEVYKKLVWERGWGGGARVLGACYRPLQRAHVMRVRGVSRPQELRVEDHRHRLDVQVAELAARVVLQRLDIPRHYQLPVHPRHVVQGFSRPRATRSSPSPLMASLNLFSPARLNFEILPGGPQPATIRSVALLASWILPGGPQPATIRSVALLAS